MTDNEIQIDNNEPIKEEHISDISLKHFKKDAKTNVSRKNIQKTLDYSLKAKYNIDDEEIRNAILSVHGLDKKRFDFVNSIENLINKQIADESIDQNANKNEKTIEGIMQEAFNPVRKLIGYDLLYRTLKTLYGKPEAKRLSGEMYDMSLAINDSTKLTLPYSYYGNTPIIVKINNEIKYMTFKNLFNFLEDFAVYDDVLECYIIYSKDIYKDLSVNIAHSDKQICRDYRHNSSLKEFPTEKVKISVWDTNNGWVNVSRILKHRNHEDYILYQIENGDFALVTGDHPVYMQNGGEKKMLKNLK